MHARQGLANGSRAFIISERVIHLVFNPAPGSNRTYLAEVGFYGDGSACLPETIVTPRAHARARGYVVSIIILYIVWTFFGTNLLSPKILTLRCLF